MKDFFQENDFPDSPPQPNGSNIVIANDRPYKIGGSSVSLPAHERRINYLSEIIPISKQTNMEDMTMTSENADQNPWSSISPLSAVFVIMMSLALGAYLCSAIYDPDGFWHLALGILAENKTLLTQTSWLAQPLRGPHFFQTSWLFDYALAKVYASDNFASLAMLKAGFHSLGVLLLTFVFVRRSGSLPLGLGVSVITSIGIYTDSPFTPEILAYPLLAVLIELAYTISERGLRTWNLLSFALVSVVLANISELSLVLPFFLPILAANDQKQGLRRSPKSLLVLSVLSLLSLCLTPNFGAQIWPCLLGALSQMLSEVTLQTHLFSIYFYPSAIMLLLAATIVLLLSRKLGSLSRGEAMLVLLLACLCLASREYAKVSLIYFAFLNAKILGEARSDSSDLGLHHAIANLHINLKTLPYPGMCFLCAVFWILNVNSLRLEPVESLVLPGSASSYLASEAKGAVLLNPPEVGGFLLYRFAESGQLSGPLLTADPSLRQSAPRMLAELAQVKDLKGHWRELLLELKADFVLCRNFDPIAALLQISPEWELVHAPDLSLWNQSAPAWIVFRKKKQQTNVEDGQK